MMKKLVISTSLTFLTFLAGCGGGGGGSSTPSGPVTSTSSFALNTAANRLLTETNTFSVSTQQGGNTFQIQSTYTPQADTTFEGQPAKRVTLTSILRVNGVTQQTDVSDIFFTIDPITVAGNTTTGDDDGQNYMVTTSTSPLPASANVGSAGPFFQGNYFLNSTKTSPRGNTVATYSVEADTASTAFLCINRTDRNTVNTVIYSEAGCFRINAAGAILGYKVDATADGVTLSFR